MSRLLQSPLSLKFTMGFDGKILSRKPCYYKVLRMSWEFARWGGGGGGFRTRVRQSSALRSTCLGFSIQLTQHDPRARVFRASSFSFNRSA